MKKRLGIFLFAVFAVAICGNLIQTHLAEVQLPNSSMIAEFPPPNSIMYSVYQ